MSLQEKLDALKAQAGRGRVSPEARKVMNRALEDLIVSCRAQQALALGGRAPSFTLPGHDGAPVSSHHLLSSGPLVVSFYRGVWCPYCNLELKALQGAMSAIDAAGGALVAISPQTPPNSRRAARENGLDFQILSDAGNSVADAFGLRWRLPDDLLQTYKDLGIDLALINGDASGTLPMPARYVIARNGTVVYAEVNPDYMRRPEPELLLPALRQAAQAYAA